MELLAIIFGFVMDLIFGDPRRLPHPIKIIGKAIEKFERPLRKIKNEKFAGSILAIAIILVTFLVTFGILRLTYSANKFLGFFISAIFIYTSLSIKDLYKESILVYNDLKNGNIVQARKDLSMIVGRDTGNLDEPEIVRATVETVAESIVDGIVSPLFYAILGSLFVGGSASLALTYKAINTLDSMVGYKNEKYKKFGFFSAKLDDLVNFVPARISAFFIALSAAICGYNGRKALNIVFKDGIKSTDKNSEMPEASMAGTISLRLGGVNYYQGISVFKEYLGDSSCRIAGTREDIKKALKIMYVSSYVALASLIIFCLLLCK